MTCRARADRWREELDLLQEEMRHVIAFLEWKSSSWRQKVGSRSDSVMADVQHGIDAYAHKQANTYHELTVSLANQWLPRLLELKLDTTWVKNFPWADGITRTQDSSNTHKNPSSSNPTAANTTPSCTRQDGSIELVNRIDSGDESDNGDDLGGTYDEGEHSDGLVMGFECDDKYMS